MTDLADDPLAFNVRVEALWLLEIILTARPHPFDQEGFARITDRVWVEKTGDDRVCREVSFQFLFDPFDGAETGTLKMLTLLLPEQSNRAADLKLKTSDQDELFWWSIWLTDFRASRGCD